MKLGSFFALTTLSLYYSKEIQVSAQLPPGDFVATLRQWFVRPKDPEPPRLEDCVFPEDDPSCDIPKAQACEDTLWSQDEQRDPMLFPMPIDRPPYFYDVYVRKDISSFYQEEPGSRTEVVPAYPGQACKFINISPFTMDLYWGNPTGENRFFSKVGPFEAGGTSSFAGSQFFFKRHDTKEITCQFQVELDTVLYYCDPFVFPMDDEAFVAKQGTYVANDGILFSLDSLTSYELDQYENHRYNLEFATLYKNFTGGSDWLSNYGAPKPWHPIWRSDYLGQEHQVRSKETHFEQIPDHLGVRSGKRYATKRDESAPVPFQKYRTPEKTLNITIKAVSVEPRAFQLDNFLSEAEVDHMLEVIGRHEMQRSTTGSVCNKDDGESCHVSGERTSTNTWVRRDESPILDAIYRRAADALRLDEALLRRRDSNEPVPEVLKGLEESRQADALNEPFQVVHYGETQEYKAHHDFGYERNSRSINLCLYLNEGMVGGETSFVRGRSAETDQGIDMTPKKGRAMIFYMVNPDGNRDDLSQHAAKPVLEGEKYFANMWIWDPYKA